MVSIGIIELFFITLTTLPIIVTVAVCVLCYVAITSQQKQSGQQGLPDLPEPPKIPPVVHAWQLLREATLEIPASTAHQLKSTKPTFAFMMQENCPGCGAMYAEWLALSRVLTVLELDVDLVKINISRDKPDENGEMLHKKLKFDNVPTFYFVKDGSWDSRVLCSETTVDGWVKFLKQVNTTDYVPGVWRFCEFAWVGISSVTVPPCTSNSTASNF
jgi:hypothetical protein